MKKITNALVIFSVLVIFIGFVGCSDNNNNITSNKEINHQEIAQNLENGLISERDIDAMNLGYEDICGVLKSIATLKGVEEGISVFFVQHKSFLSDNFSFEEFIIKKPLPNVSQISDNRGRATLISYNNNWRGSDGNYHHTAIFEVSNTSPKIIEVFFWFCYPPKFKKNVNWWANWHEPNLGNNRWRVLVDGKYYWGVRISYAYLTNHFIYNSIKVYD